MRRLSWLAPLAFGGCFLVNSNEISITYDVNPPQEFAQDFGNQTGPLTIRAETDAGAVKLGTLPSQPAGKLTSKTTLPLTEAGKQLLATLAKDYKTPFNVLAVIHHSVSSGQPVPSGKIDVFVQPEI